MKFFNLLKIQTCPICDLSTRFYSRHIKKCKKSFPIDWFKREFIRNRISLTRGRSRQEQILYLKELDR